MSAQRQHLIEGPRATVPASLRAGLLQRKCACGGTPGPDGECAECRRKRLALQRRAMNQAVDHSVPPIVGEVLRSPGRPLDANTRASMERRFGHDFSQVRVHADEKAAESAQAANALAYTVGRDVVFGRGQYAPHTASGQRLLAHELTHVVQQSSAPGAVASGIDRGASDPLEQAADRLAERVMSKGDAPPATSLGTLPRLSAPRLQRYRVPSELPCSEVVDWLNANSPYSPEWAETRCTYDFNGGLRVSSSTSPGGVQLRARGHDKLTVSVSCPVDRPQWSPSRRENRDAEVQAWKAMREVLDAHENEHRRIGREWRATLEGRFRAVDVTVTGSDESDAREKLIEKVQADQKAWMAEAQAAQDAIDPFRSAILECP